MIEEAAPIVPEYDDGGGIPVFALSDGVLTTDATHDGPVVDAVRRPGMVGIVRYLGIYPLDSIGNLSARDVGGASFVLR